MADKKVNYTKIQEARLAEVYDAEASWEVRSEQVDDLAEEFGKKRASIVAKLSNMKVYVKKNYTTKSGGESVRKGAIVGLIAGVMGETEEAFDTLSKANKTVLEAIWAFVEPEEVTPENENDSQPEGGETA